MGTYFHGWRRKLGVVTLGLACVFAAGWVRSHTTADSISLRTGDKTEEILHSDFSRLSWIRYVWKSPFQHVVTFHKSESASQPDEFEQQGVIRQWRCWGFQYGRDTTGSVLIEIWIMPYYSIAVPLTLLSTFLLLTKRRPSTPKKITEPIPIDGA